MWYVSSMVLVYEDSQHISPSLIRHIFGFSAMSKYVPFYLCVVFKSDTNQYVCIWLPAWLACDGQRPSWKAKVMMLLRIWRSHQRMTKSPDRRTQTNPGSSNNNSAAPPPRSLAEPALLFPSKTFPEHCYKCTGKRPDVKYCARSSW